MPRTQTQLQKQKSCISAVAVRQYACDLYSCTYGCVTRSLYVASISISAPLAPLDPPVYGAETRVTEVRARLESIRPAIY
jgi:hypothetical protein